MVNQAVLNSSVEGDRNSGKKNWRAISSAQVHINKGKQTIWKGWSMITTKFRWLFQGHVCPMQTSLEFDNHWQDVILAKVYQ